MHALPQIDWFAFHARNEQTLFGCGTREEADVYQDLLNAKRAFDHYAFRLATGEEIFRVDYTDEGFNICDALRDLAESQDDQFALIERSY